MLTNCVEGACSITIGDTGGTARLSPAAASCSSQSLKAYGPDAPDKATARGRLLIADDNPLNLDVASRILQGLGYEVVTAEGGSAALTHLAQSRFDVVFMDCEMPDIGGIEATKLARRAEEARLTDGQTPQRVPIIALTAHSADEIHDRCVAAGMNDFITKPLTKKKLQEALTRWLGESPATRFEPGSEATEPAVTPATSEQILCIDTSALTSLMAARPGDAAHFIARLVSRFEELAARQAAQLWQAYREGRSDEVGSLAHALKSSAGAVGAYQVASRLSYIERHVRDHGLTGLEPGLELLADDLSAALSSLSTLFGKLE